MTTTREQISGWFDEAARAGATHMLVVCDTYDWSDYPIYVRADPGATDFSYSDEGTETLLIAPSARAAANYKTGTNMQQLMECYKLDMDKDTQMAEHRAHHYD